MLTRTKWIFLLLILLLFLPNIAFSKVDSARLTFQKTVGQTPTGIYTVKKGENLAVILKKLNYGKDISLSAIKRLNPRLVDLNKLYPGQKIILPPLEAKAVSPMDKDREDKPFLYTIKENDSISRILLEELKLNPREALHAYRRIKALNTNIEDMANLRPGSALLIPPDLVKVTALAYQQNTAPTETIKAEQKGVVKMHPSLLAVLEIIRPVIKRMKGSVSSRGSYFIPLEGTSQITIDSSCIPSVQMDDGTTVFLDYENRFSDKFKQLVRRYWRNYFFLTEKDLKDPIHSLFNIINLSKNYSMEPLKKPLTVYEKPVAVVSPDWLITGKKNDYVQGIFLLSAEEEPLPETVRSFLEKIGFSVTEMSADLIPCKKMGSTSPDEPIILKDVRAYNGIALAEELLKALGETVVRQKKIALFKKETDGFNLSITADLFCPKGERQLIVLSKKPPDQFVKMLADSRYDVVSIGQNEKGKAVVEALLKKAGYPVSFGYFSCLIPEGGKTRFEISFPALSFTRDTERVYLFDFDLPVDLLPVISSGSKTTIIRY